MQAWLEGTTPGLSPPGLVTLFERALSALRTRTIATLGEVTYTAIMNRVLYSSAKKYPFLSTVEIDTVGIRCETLRAAQAARNDHNLLEAIRFVLVEFLRVLGNLTCQVLTPALHAELSKVALDEPERTTGKKRGKRGPLGSGEDDIEGAKS